VKDFNQLTNRGRVLRLRKMALAALENYDLDVKRVRLLTNDMNGIFRVDTAGGTKYVLRICIPAPGGHSLDTIRSEMTWLAALRRDTDLDVPRPLATRDGALVTTVEVPGVPEPRHCVIFSWVYGRDLADRPTLENWRKLGEFAARLHDHGAAFRPPDGFSINRYDKVFPFQEPVILFDEPHRHLFPPDGHEVYQRTMERVQVALDRLNDCPGGMSLIHGDLHHWNVKVYRGRISALDFEDLMWGYPVQDVATIFYYLQNRKDYPALWEAFRQGYTGRRAWPEQYPGEIDTFIAGRTLVLANYIIQDDSPEYKKMAPGYVERGAERLRTFLDRE